MHEEENEEEEEKHSSFGLLHKSIGTKPVIRHTEDLNELPSFAQSHIQKRQSIQ